MGILRASFWVALAIVAYVYAGYPLLLAFWARLAPRPVRRDAGASSLPGVCIVMAARNERPDLRARLGNLLALDYPCDKRQIVVVSDGSTDGTEELVRQFAPDVELVVHAPRGKAAALNAGVARARHEILVFADARQAFAHDAVRQIVRNFADPDVGAVSGELVLDCETAADAGAAPGVTEGVGLYWRYEKWLRRREGLVASTLGVSGAICAMRRACWRDLPPGTILDDVLGPMRVVLGGKRVIFDERAIAYDRSARDAATETARKVRTLAGNYQLLWLEPRLLVPFVNPVWLQFVSHKLGRLVVPYALIVLLVASAALVRTGAVYTLAFVALAAVALLAAYGAKLERAAGSRAGKRAVNA